MGWFNIKVANYLNIELLNKIKSHNMSLFLINKCLFLLNKHKIESYETIKHYKKCASVL